MPPLLPLALGASAAAIALHQHQARESAERLAAALLETLLNAIDANDSQTGAHVRRVARYSLILADAADLSPTEQRSVERIALFHDIGKIHEALFDIIHEPAKLSPEERRAIATHPQKGADVLAPIDAFYPDLRLGVLAHHERWDGAGYPCGLKGENIPFAARLVSIADTFDAVTHSRRYRSGRDSQKGAEVISAGCGSQFDPVLVDLFLCPPVFECVKHAMQEPLVSKRPGGERRRHRQNEAVAPDLEFRWRYRPRARKEPVIARA